MSSPWILSEPPVPLRLRQDVLHVRIFESRAARPYSVEVAPVALPGLVFHQRGRGRAISAIETRLGTSTRLPLGFVYGPGTLPSTMHFAAGPHITIQIILKPCGLRTVFGLDARTLKNGFSSLSKLPGAPKLGQLLAMRSPLAQAQFFFEYLARRIDVVGVRDSLVEDALQRIEHRSGPVRLPELLRELSVSERQLERRFSRSVGVTPKAFLRIRRFNEAVRRMKSGKYKTLARIAYELGFSDQAHFIRDLKEFSRVTPSGISDRLAQFHELAGLSFDA